MDYRFFGSTGVKVSELVMGTQTFGWVADEKTSHEMADRFVAAGGNCFDTANIYNEGVSETMLGAWLNKKGNRDDYFVTSKVFFPAGEGVNDSGLSRKHILQSVDGSLKRLQTDYIDLYQTHCYDYTTRIEETLQAFDDLVRSGKVRYIGISNWSASQLATALQIARCRGWSPIVSLQAEYSLIVRSSEWELIPLCEQENLAFLAWSPLAGGWMTAKYRRNQKPPENSRVGRQDRWDDQPEQRDGEPTWRVVDALLEVSKEIGKSPAQIALNWILRQSSRITPIIGARTLEQLEENLGSTGWSLSDDALAVLDRASGVPLPYPYRFIKRYAKRGEAD
jgi:aryl-alcohol dehydrogenase-like predicted oxidoreductase